ncbi:MAG TPA: ABC transporter ATP-binding protein, partial [Candidatus Udaeobacter sp.]|nr:ABC transporter ATP-binding protein [Candidatus Udaeobacter sp.]
AKAPAIRIAGLEKTYRHPMTLRAKPVLRGLELEVAVGEVWGFLGLNGAGKTTTIRCLLGLIHPDRGMISVLGGEPGARASRRRIGYLPENPSLPDYLTPREVLDLMGRLCEMARPHRRRRVDELLSELRLERFARTPLRKLSKGTVQRVGIAQAVLHEPELLILDEPMSGLDPLGRRDVRSLIDRERTAGRTIFFSSHIVPDVEAICDRVGVIDHGRLIKIGRIDELTTVRLQAVEIQVKNAPADVLAAVLGPHDTIEPRGTTCRILVHDPERVDRVMFRVLEAGGRIENLERRRERLEDYFIRTAEEHAA